MSLQPVLEGLKIIGKGRGRVRVLVFRTHGDKSIGECSGSALL